MAEIDHAVLPGTYDPVTLGHLDVIRRSSRLFTRLTVGVAASKAKRGVGTTFTLAERVEMIEVAVAEAHIEGVCVLPFEGLLVDFCHEVGAGCIVKGLRTMTDFEFELQQADLNAKLAPELESVFVMADPALGFVSSSVVRELASLGSTTKGLVPANVEERLAAHFAKVR